jgi:hypothetical protein
MSSNRKQRRAARREDLRRIRDGTYLNCWDCGVNTSRVGEWYMVHDHVWLAAMPDDRGILCIPCLERRLGRPLEWDADFRLTPEDLRRRLKMTDEELDEGPMVFDDAETALCARLVEMRAQLVEVISRADKLEPGYLSALADVHVAIMALDAAQGEAERAAIDAGGGAVASRSPGFSAQRGGAG